MSYSLNETAQEDLFKSWKTSRFVIADRTLFDHELFTVILSDISFWTKNIDTLVEWCKVNGGEIKGMTVDFRTSKELTLFILRWS